MTTVQGTLQNPDSTPSTNSFVRFWLRGCNGNQPRIAGTALIAPDNGAVYFQDFVPNSSGVISGSIYSNDLEVSAGGQVGVTWWGVQIFTNGNGGPETAYFLLNGVTFNLNSATPMTTAPVVAAPTGDSTYARLDAGNHPFTGNALFKKLEDIRFADQFAGGSVGAKIDAACADLGSNQGLVVIPSSMGAGNSLIGIPQNVRILDLRGLSGPDNSGSEAQTLFKDVLLRGRYTSSTVGDIYPVLQVHCEPFSGGSNPSGGPPKTSYASFFGTMDARTPGQHWGHGGFHSNFSNGDMIGFYSAVYGFGGMTGGGDEGTEGISTLAAQGQSLASASPVIFSGTVQANASGVLTFSSSNNSATMGEGRPVIITTGAKVYSTGTVTGIAGSPPTVTGSGTGWAAQFGSGAKTNLFFALDADVNGAAKFVLPIASITDDTHLVLAYAPQGANAAYPTSNTGTYKIYKGGTATAVGFGFTSITVSPNSDFAATDTFEQPLGSLGHVYGAHFGISTVLPNTPTKHAGIAIDNTSPAATPAVGYGILVHSFSPAQFESGIVFDTPLTTRGAWFTQTIGSSGVGPLIQYDDTTANALVSLIKVKRNDGTPVDALSYQRAAGITQAVVFLGSQTVVYQNGTVQVAGPGISMLGSSSGAVAVVVPAAAGSNTLTIPAATGTAVLLSAATSQKSESGADANVLTFTPPGVAGTYRLRFVLSLSAANAATLGWTATWKDSNGNAKAPTNLSLFLVGTAAPALTFTTSATDDYYGEAQIDIDNSGTNIVVKLTFTGTSFTGKASATIERIN